MPAATRRTCQAQGCNLGEDGASYITQEGLDTHESVLRDLELHVFMAHSTRGPYQAINNEVKPDKFPRPEIADPATDTAWQYFLSSWESYKRATSLSGQAACDQLWHCPSAALKK